MVLLYGCSGLTWFSIKVVEMWGQKQWGGADAGRVQGGWRKTAELRVSIL